MCLWRKQVCFSYHKYKAKFNVCSVTESIYEYWLGSSPQVEDMLKRSFAEFHAQKKLPEKQQLLMRKLAQPTKSIE